MSMGLSHGGREHVLNTATPERCRDFMRIGNDTPRYGATPKRSGVGVELSM